MAEVVGLTASVIGIAGLATKIVKTSVKVKDILEQVDNVPAQLQRYLEQIQLFSPLLAYHINDDGPPALRGAVAVAMVQCQQAADDLGQLAEDLYAHVHEGGRARHKIRAARVVLQKDVLVSHEKRLSSAMQMLMMACQMYGLEQQTYLINLQKSQPDVIVAKILGRLQAQETTHTNPQLAQEPVGQDADLKTSQMLVTQRRTRLWTRQFQPYLKLGVDDLTGSLEVQRGSMGAQEDSWVLRFRLNLPRWLSSKFIDSIAQRSQAGWSYYLHTSTLHPEDSIAWKRAMEVFLSGTNSLQRLQSMIAEGQISVFDARQRNHHLPETLMEAAISCRNWQICDFLARYDIQTRLYPSHRFLWIERENHVQYLRNVASQYSHLPMFFWALFQKYDGPAAHFHAIRRFVWPDCEFYDVSFLPQRLLLARVFAETSNMTSQTLPMKALLSRNGDLFLSEIGSLFQDGRTHHSTIRELRRLIMSLQRKSQLKTRDIAGANSWAKLMEKLLTHILDSMNYIGSANESSSTSTLRSSVYSCLFDISILGHMYEGTTEPIRATIPERQAEVFVSGILCQYIESLLKCGVDICEFGTFVESKLMGERPHIMTFLSIMPKRTSCIHLDIKGVRTGAKPNDWKLWFGERTDEFAGDFWQLIDPAPMAIPGAWVEEE